MNVLRILLIMLPFFLAGQEKEYLVKSDFNSNNYKLILDEFQTEANQIPHLSMFIFSESGFFIRHSCFQVHKVNGMSRSALNFDSLQDLYYRLKLDKSTWTLNSRGELIFTLEGTKYFLAPLSPSNIYNEASKIERDLEWIPSLTEGYPDSVYIREIQKKSGIEQKVIKYQLRGDSLILVSKRLGVREGCPAELIIFTADEFVISNGFSVQGIFLRPNAAEGIIIWEEGRMILLNRPKVLDVKKSAW